MKIKLDENLPESLLTTLTALGHDTDNVRLEGLAGRPDPDVWQAAQEAGRFLITQDLDFSDMRRFRPGTHAGLLLIRLRIPGRLALTNRIREICESEQIERWAGCFVLVTDRKIRIHRPGT